LVAEGLGTALLRAAVVGSGIIGERLAAGRVAPTPLANTAATTAALVALILALGPISGGPSQSAAERLMADRPALRVRLATGSDAPAIADIYNQGIAERIATFETAVRSARDVEAQLASKADRYPTVVVEMDGQVVAWASAGAYRARPAYAGVAEHSVYVARRARGVGAGRAALDALAAECQARGFWKLVSRIFPENTASLALHERAGFRVVGVYRRHGQLDGQWRDCVIVEKLLGAGTDG
jgi:phosphinothricin acetyltransferase